MKKLILLCVLLSGCTVIYKSENISVQQPTVLLGSGMDETRPEGDSDGQ